MAKSKSRKSEPKRKTMTPRKAAAPKSVEDGTALIALDPWLEPYAQQLRDRWTHYQWVRSRIDETGGILGPISKGHHFFGFNRGKQGSKAGVWYREWAPARANFASSATSTTGIVVRAT